HQRSAKNLVADIENEKDELTKLRLKIKNSIDFLTGHLQDTEKNAQRKRDEWQVENDRVFVMPESHLGCPTCNRPFDESTVENSRATLEGNFNQDKAKNLQSIVSVGTTLKAEIDDYKIKIEGRKKELAEVNEILDKLLIIDTHKQTVEAYNELIDKDEN